MVHSALLFIIPGGLNILLYQYTILYTFNATKSSPQEKTIYFIECYVQHNTKNLVWMSYLLKTKNNNILILIVRQYSIINTIGGFLIEIETQISKLITYSLANSML